MAHQHKMGPVYGVDQSAELDLASCSFPDNTFRAWSKSGALVFAMKTPNEAWASAIAVHGTMAALGTYTGGLYVVDLVGNEIVHTLVGHEDDVLSIIHTDALVISGASDGTIRFWDTADGKSLRTISIGTWALSLAMQDNVLAVAQREASIAVFDIHNGEKVHSIDTEANAVAIDGQHLVTASEDNNVKLYSLPHYQLIHVFEGHTNWVTCVDIKNDCIVSGGYDDTVRVWDCRSKEQVHVLEGHAQTVLSISLLGSQIVSGGSDGTVRVWDARAGTLSRLLNGSETFASLHEVSEPLPKATPLAAPEETENHTEAVPQGGLESEVRSSLLEVPVAQDVPRDEQTRCSNLFCCALL
ncbi:WD repeat-containing protein wdr-5.1 [Hondaea fermentalgiana]|uniref:WD repeat-containing protein wdr-5.1 n=1 Tax=Hondaea fermentalgiana TaxID=2315210 RepID=A0A2R5GSV2_9STRA|nr:WD repeat-containing protein wdr-5.1 [Hondaea fermentalgiana]|eukprot:GBG33957.1 WD repeat-containing protein wdr-5.1 [Hondaea fermentalgiana]